MWVKFVLLSIFGFTCSLTTSFDLRGVVNGDRMASVPLGISLGSGVLDVEGICTKPGTTCQNCTFSITCVRLPSGWLKVPLEQCSNTCNAHLGGCAEQPVPECDVTSQGYQHFCEQIGIFPDAHDCRKFHLCSPPEGLPDGRPADHRIALCPRHYGYNPQTAQCSIKLENGQCKEKVVPDCGKLGELGVLPSSSNHYYVCVIKRGVLYPQIFICPHGWYFWDDGFCRPEPRPVTNEAKPDKNESKSSESSEESTTNAIAIEPASTEAPTTSKIEGFFSTEKSTTYPADTFLADKFDLSNYETIDNVEQNNNEYLNSFENNDW